MTPAQRTILLGQSWTPRRLGASLVAWWDAERSDLITQASSLVSSWKDIVGAYDVVQTTGASKPAYSATSFNSRPGITFDGLASELTLVGIPASFPIGAVAGEIWGVVDQTALAADATNRQAATYGNGASSTVRGLTRSVSVGVNRAAYYCGDGTSKHADEATVNYSGRHVHRGIADGTTIYSEIDGTRSSGVASVPATAAGRVRIGANSTASAGNFWQGVISTVLVTSILTAAEATQLYAFLNRRL